MHELLGFPWLRSKSRERFVKGIKSRSEVLVKFFVLTPNMHSAFAWDLRKRPIIWVLLMLPGEFFICPLLPCLLEFASLNEKNVFMNLLLLFWQSVYAAIRALDHTRDNAWQSPSSESVPSTTSQQQLLGLLWHYSPLALIWWVVSWQCMNGCLCS